MNVVKCLLALFLSILAGAGIAWSHNRVETEKTPISVTEIAAGLRHPWAIAFLPDGRMLVTERIGKMRIIADDGTIGSALDGLPKVDARGQGGLLDVAVHPRFADNRLVYWSFAEPGEGGNSTAVARGRLSQDESALTDVEVIFSQRPKVRSTGHFGSRLVFDGEGRLFVTLGERSSAQFRVQAQDLTSHLGKIVRLNEDGSVPKDNPFAGKDGARPEIWSYGHRNVQAAALNPTTGELWEIEHGPMGGDELNVAEAGRNYGWPVISYGVNYDGSPVGSGKAKAEGMEDPLYQWTPVIAPSGMIFYSGRLAPQWERNIFVGGLGSQALVRLEVEGRKVVHEERLLRNLGERIRDVAEGPDGAIYVATDADNGKILRIVPGS
ncbi:MAG: PQQ-dependent sugar dehydrogenase [Rhizobiales bacterium]|nr:PQQ-dependent sugar dehydrogenase [Hyphomicrobiales bacterium]